MLKGATGMAGTVQDGARGALGNALTQGIAVATGLQGRMNWAGVAVGGVVGGTVGGLRSSGPLVSGMAGAMAGAAARSLLTGTSFGDNIAAVLPDVIGSTIGNMVAGGIAGRASADSRPLSSKGIQLAGDVPLSELGIRPGDIIVTARRPGLFERIGNAIEGAWKSVRNWWSDDQLASRISMTIGQAHMAQAEAYRAQGQAIVNVLSSPMPGFYKNTAPLLSKPQFQPMTVGEVGLELLGVVGVGRPASATVNVGSKFVGPLIGKSGFRTSAEFAEAVGTRYQGFVDDAYMAAQLT